MQRLAENAELLRYKGDYMKITFEQLMLEWLHSRKETIKESTYTNYVTLLETHLLPELGGQYLSALTTDGLNDFLKEKLKSGRSDGSGGLSEKTVADIRSILVMGIEYARSRDYPCGVKGKLYYPKCTKPAIRVYTRAEQEKLENYLFQSDELICLGILAALYGGLRIGEVCALQWKDVDLNEGLIHVSKTMMRIRDISPNALRKTKVIVDRPKTMTSIRTVPLPEFLVQHIRSFSGEPAFYLLTGTEALMEPRICLGKYKQILQRAGLGDFTFHALRHTFATRCVENGFDIKSLSEILGHANVSITMQRYVHPSIDMKKEQMNRLENISVYKKKSS